MDAAPAAPAGTSSCPDFVTKNPIPLIAHVNSFGDANKDSFALLMLCAGKLPLKLKDWRPEHVEEWRDSLPENARLKFKDFFDNLPRSADGSTLASYSLVAIMRIIDHPDPKNVAFAPEIYARLQELKQQGVSCKSLEKIL